MTRLLVICGTLIILSTALGLVACGEDQQAKTVTERERIIERPARPAPRGDQAEPKPQAPAPKDSRSAGGGGITVPNVVGKNHQLAQDTMQDAGLYLLDEQDASGQGRLLLYDRNWVVVRQDPPAGSTVSDDTTIRLHAKKEGE